MLATHLFPAASNSLLMNETEIQEPVPRKEYPDSSWHRVYLGVMLFAVIVIFALWAFSRYFS
jgi:hypothetical protein